MATPKFQVKKEDEQIQVLGSGFEKHHTKEAQRAETCVRNKGRGSIKIVPATDAKGTRGFYWEVKG